MQYDYHADFDYEVINDVVAVFDRNRGNRSVTNDVNYVLETLKNTISNLALKRIIYRDSMEIFDEIIINEKGNFIEFRSINEKTLEQAIVKLNRKENIF